MDNFYDLPEDLQDSYEREYDQWLDDLEAQRGDDWPEEDDVYTPEDEVVDYDSLDHYGMYREDNFAE